jgi:hypothetical protein
MVQPAPKETENRGQQLPCCGAALAITCVAACWLSQCDTALDRRIAFDFRRIDCVPRYVLHRHENKKKIDKNRIDADKCSVYIR